MGRDAFEQSPAAREVFESADAALGFPLSKLCFEGPEDALRPTEIQQPAILTTSVALLRALEAEGPVEPAFVAGHSLGEYSALVAAGALSFETAVALVHARGRFMQEAVPDGAGAMAAILGAEVSDVEEACRVASARGIVEPANYNSPQQTVIAGETAAVEAAGVAAKERGARRVAMLPVSAPFHCAMMEPAAEKLAPELASIAFADCRVPVVTNVEARANTAAGRIGELLRRQVTAPVRFSESVLALREAGVTATLEVGPGRVLSGLVARIDRGLKRASLGSWSDLAEARAFADAEMGGEIRHPSA